MVNTIGKLNVNTTMETDKVIELKKGYSWEGLFWISGRHNNIDTWNASSYPNGNDQKYVGCPVVKL